MFRFSYRPNPRAAGQKRRVPIYYPDALYHIEGMEGLGSCGEGDYQALKQIGAESAMHFNLDGPVRVCYFFLVVLVFSVI